MIKAHFREISTEILKEISIAKHSLKIAVAWFTNNEIFDTLLQKCNQSNIIVELIIICDSINIKPYGLDFDSFIQAGGKMYFGDSKSLMHHKFCIVDDRVLINGSYNWTYWAETSNYENITVMIDEKEVIDDFNQEFENLISGKEPLQSIDLSLVPATDSDDQLINYSVATVNEYISSAIYLGEHGKEDAAIKIFEELNTIDRARTSRVLQTGLLSGKQFYETIYQTISAKTYDSTTEKSYKSYCNDILYFINKGDYLLAVNTSNVCASKYPRRFSVHVYCGDAKMKLNDSKGAREEYMKALNYNHSKGTKIIYYSKVFNYYYFPQADIYLKLAENDKVIQTLKDAVTGYRILNIPKGVSKAETYLKRIENNETILRIV